SIQEDKSKPPVKKFKNVRKSEGFKCVVCGDKPTGYHYDVLSCNGCKTFFRRTIIAGRTFKCTKNGTCEFDKDFRCVCRSCRFEKCVGVGMNSKGIQWPSSAKRGSSSSTSDDDNNKEATKTPPNVRQVQVIPRTIANPAESAFCGQIEDLLTKEMRLCSIREKCSLFTSHHLSEILHMPVIIGSNQPSERLLIDPRQKRTEFFEKLFSMNPIKLWMISDLHLVTEYCKSFSAFNRLSHMDKMTLIAHMGGLQLMITQSYYSVRSGHGTTTFPDGSGALDMIETKSSRCSNVLDPSNTPWIVELFSQPVQLMQQLQLSDAVYALMRAVALFSPLDDELSYEGRKLISEERDRLTDMLTKQLFSEYGSAAPTKMVAIQSMIQTMYRLNEKRRQQFIYFNIVKKDLDLSPLGRAVHLREKS
ncbi:hypothetical protein PFISCL1PPCAC_24489, partial [Pristionchus fissidentatus]